ncbi:MAG: hypothetical protein ER33_15455 [Cyanobium sp. CACIAM 14]|nr:MAG: hypothetical protein ER33_15455 [Cyanobium sp. CACIAM 14]
MLERCNFPLQDASNYREAIALAFERVIASGQVILSGGVQAFEEAFAAWLGDGFTAEHCVGVGNGTDALELALRCAGVTPGDGVIVPSFTAYATVASLLRIGAVPHFADVAPSRPVICPLEVERLLAGRHSTRRIRAVIAVHLYGEACDLRSLRDICDHRSVALIEDCAQATGTMYEGGSIGTWGDFASFSFYPTKNLAALGDGGMLVLGRQSDLSRLRTARRLRTYGWNREREAVEFGVNSRLDEVQAWILWAKLKDLSKSISARRSLAGRYRDLIGPWAGQEGISLPGDGINWKHSYHLYVITVHPMVRTNILSRGVADGIPYAVHYPLACHQQAYIAQRLEATPVHLPHTERLAASVLSLPLNPYLTEQDVQAVSSHLHALVSVV